MKTQEDKRKELDAELSRDYEAFNLNPYTGFIPDGLMEKFLVAFFTHPPSKHEIKPEYANLLVKKKERDLNHLDVGLVINVLFDTPFEKLHITMDDALEFHSQCYRAKLEYNKIGYEFQLKMGKKKETLEKIYGLDKNTTSLGHNGRIVN